MSTNIYGATTLIGGGTAALDSIDGAILNNNDTALVVTTSESYHYILDDTSGDTENSPFVISPDANAGTKRWLLQQPSIDTIKFGNGAPITGHISTVHDFINHVCSSTPTEGFGITDNANGTVTIAAGAALLRNTLDVHTSSIIEYDVPGGTTGTELTALIDESMNYVFADYNSGTPKISIYTSIPSDAGFTQVPIWFITRVNNTVIHTVDMRDFGLNYAVGNSKKDFYVNGYEHGSGGTILGFTNRNISITAGTFYITSVPITHSAFDTSGSETFSYAYSDGASGWTRVAGQTQIDNTQYDDGDGTLGTIAVNDYGVHWIFIVLNQPAELIVVYGTTSHTTLASAEASTIPSSLPPEVAAGSSGRLVGRAIIRDGEAVITEIASPFVESLVTGTPTSHNGLGGLQGGITDEYYHLTNTQHIALTGGTPTFSALNLTTDTTGKLNLGTGTDMDVYYDGTKGQINTNLVAASDLNIQCGTDKTLVLDEPVWIDVLPSAISTVPGPAAPAVSTYNGNLAAYEFLGATTLKDMQLAFKMPHNWVEGTAITFHLHLYVPDDVTGGDIRFVMDYDWVNYNASPGTPSTGNVATLTRGASAGANGNAEIEWTALPGTGKNISSILQVYLVRDPTDAGDTFAASVWLISVECHAQVDTIGSRQIATK